LMGGGRLGDEEQRACWEHGEDDEDNAERLTECGPLGVGRGGGWISGTGQVKAAGAEREGLEKGVQALEKALQAEIARQVRNKARVFYAEITQGRVRRSKANVFTPK
jgi:hypothetical protein